MNAFFDATTRLRIRLIWLTLFSTVSITYAQLPDRIRSIFPEKTVFHTDVAYAGDTLRKHLLDLYLPPKTVANPPLVVWVHGGAWMLNDKYADMSYMKSTIRTIIEQGYALASIDYRYSTTAPFPAQIQDCNQALDFLYQHAAQYGFDRNRIALVGFSAGGHLASLLALSNNTPLPDFYANRKKPAFRIKTVVDFYGPADLVATIRRDVPLSDTAVASSESRLLGASPLLRPDLAKKASPVTYIDKNDPPFLIIHGEKDESVPPAQSVLLSSWLSLSGIKNEVIIVPNAPHYGPMFDADMVRQRVAHWLNTYLK